MNTGALSGNRSLAERFFLKGALPYAWIAAAVVAVFFRTLFFGFVHLDDDYLIINNTRFLSSISNIPAAFTQNVFHLLHQPETQYRPLKMALYILNAQAGPSSPFAYHCVNVMLHCCASCLVFLLFSRLGCRRPPAFFFSMVFAVHPVLVQAVAWIPGRADSLMAVFILAAFISLIAAIERRGVRYYFWHFFWFVCALLTKETSPAFAAAGLLYVFWIKRERLCSLRAMVLAGGWTASIGALFVLRHIVLRNPAVITPGEMAASLLEKLPAVIPYAGKVLFPFNLSVYPILRDTTFVYGIAAVLLLALGALFPERGRRPLLLFGAFWFLLFLLPPFLQPDPTATARFFEHRLYLPVIGLFLFTLETRVVEKLSEMPRLSFAVGAVLVLACAAGAFFRSGHFKDRMSFWSSAARTSPSSPGAHLSLGYVYYLDNLWDKAQEEYARTLELNPREKMAHNNIGLISMHQGRLREAEEEYRKELAINPRYDNAHFNLGILYYRTGRKEEAVSLWEKTLELNPDYNEACYNLLVHFYTVMDYGRARQYAREYLKRGGKLPAQLLQEIHFR
jgi:tetratricopeptide (TPR) repeat protein